MAEETVGNVKLGISLDTSGLTGKINSALNQVNKQAMGTLNGLSKGTSKQLMVMSGNVSDVIGGMTKKLAAGLGIAGIGAFTKSCLDLGSDLTEVQNVVDTAFGGMSGQANAWAKDAMTNFGLSETSAKKYMGVFGQMSSAMGITGQAALDMSEKVTGLTGDVASFYNISQDEAYTKLKSIWTGETESLKDLGVVMTQTNLDQYALNNGFSKTTAKMTQQEQALLRYQYVTSTLANASGDFIKTQDSWANQTRVLTLRFDQLKATLGQGFIALFTPIIKGVNTCLIGLQHLANGFTTFVAALTGTDLSNSTGGIADNLVSMGDDAANVVSNVGGIGDAAGKTAKKIEKSLTSFDKINKLSEPVDSDSSTSGSSGTGGASGGTGLVPNVSKDTAGASSAISDFSESVKKALEPLKAISFDNLIDALGNLKKAAEPLTEKLFAGLSWAYYNIFVPLATWTIQDLLPAFVNLLAAALTVLNSALDALQPLWQWAWDSFLEPLAKWTGGVIVDVLELLTKALYGVSGWVDNNQGTFDAMVVTLGLFAAAWKAIDLLEFITNAGGVVGILGKLTTALYACTLGKIKDKVETLYLCGLYAKDFVLSIGASAAKLYEQAKAFTALQIAKAKDKLETLQLSALYAKDFVLGIAQSAKALAESAAQWVVSTASKIADTAATVAHTAATWLATAATTAFGVAMTVLTSPITLVIAALVALGVGIYELVTHWDVVKEAAGTCWDWIVGKWNAAGTWFSGIWQQIQGAFSTFDNFVQSIFNTDFSNSFGFIGNIMNGFFQNCSNIFGDIKQVFSGLTDFVTGIFSGNWSQAWNGIVSAFGGVFGGIVDIAKSPINMIIGLINGMINGIESGINGISSKVNSLSFNVPDWVPGIGGKHFGFNLPRVNMGNVPYLAQGGYVEANTPQLAMIGDNRHQGEVVAPEDKIYSIAKQAIEDVTGTNASSTQLERVIQLLMQIIDSIQTGDLIMQVGDQELARIMQRGLTKYNRRYNKVSVEES